MLKQLRHVALDLLQLVQLQGRINNREQIAGFWMFINKHALAVANYLFFHLEQSLAFEHHCQDVARRDITFVIQFNQFPQQRFGSVFLDWLRRGSGRFINSVPIRNKALSFARAVTELLLPASFTHVRAPELLLLVKQQRVILLLVGEGLRAGLASMRAGLNIPFVHW